MTKLQKASLLNKNKFYFKKQPSRRVLQKKHLCKKVALHFRYFFPVIKILVKFPRRILFSIKF